MPGAHGDHSGSAGVDRRPRLLADALAVALSRHGYTLLDLTDQPEPRLPMELVILDDRSRAQTRARVVIELPDEPNAPARVHVDGVEVTTPITHLTELEAILRGLVDQP